MAGITRAVLLLSTCAWLAPGAAAPGGELNLGQIAGTGWRAQGLGLSWAWHADGALQLELRIAEVRLEQPALRLDDVRVRCPRLQLQDGAYLCPAAELWLAAAPAEYQATPASFAYRPGEAAWELELRGLRHCGGRLDGHFAGDAQGWRAELAASDLAADCLATTWSPELPIVPGTGARASGTATLAAAARALTLEFVLDGNGVGFDRADGGLAGEGLALRLRGRLSQDPAGRRGEAELAVTAGALYLEPWLFDVADGALRLELAGSWPLAGPLEIERLQFSQGDAYRAAGSMRLDPAAPWPPQALRLGWESAELPLLYRTLLQPWLIGTVLDDLQPGGRLSGELAYRDGDWQARVRPEAVSLLDGRGRFALSGLDGELAWGSRAGPASRLDWDGGHLLRLALGAGEARFRLAAGRLELLAPLRLPLVDGALAVARLQVDGLGGTAPVAELAATLEPVSLQALSVAFGWPPMAGTLAGELPGLRLAERTLSVDGTLRVAAFDGEVSIDGLQLERMLGPLPVLRAEVQVDDLDLELLTRTFTIGRIEGRLAGRIDGLLLQDWRPVRFDAVLQTPADDRSRHRISQRAIDSLSSLGGLSGALSRSALRFFDDFGYARLGLRCRLRGAVCELDGVEPAATGYYLVKGGGLPRIDVIGHQRRVDWTELLDRLQRAMQDPAPVVR